MSQSKAVGTVTIKRLRNGDSLQLTINRSGRFYQIIPSGGGTPTPDFSKQAEQPTLTPVVTSARNSLVIPKGYRWLLDGNVIDPTDPNFNIDSATGVLTITGNKFTSSADAYTHTFTCEVTVNVNGAATNDVISQTVDFEVRESNGSSYWGQTQSNGLVLSSELDKTVVTPLLYKGFTELDYQKKEFYVKWFAVNGGTDNDTPVGSNQQDAVHTSGKSLVVKRDGVDGSANFICRFYTDSAFTNEVEAVGVTIRDNSDTYHLVITGDTQVAKNGTTQLTIQVYNINTGEVEDASRFNVDVKEAEGLNDITIGYTLQQNMVDGHSKYSSATFSMPESAMLYDGKECEVIATFEATL